MYDRASAAPVDPTERIATVDILRGLALFFMILVHFHQFMRIESTGLEDLIGWVVWVGIEAKAWGTFAFLFGVGFAVLLRRLDARDVAVGPLYVRRLAALAVFGIAAQMLFGFTILFMYATTAVWLLIVRRWPTRVLLVAAAVAACAMPVYTEVTALYALRSGVKVTMSADTAVARGQGGRDTPRLRRRGYRTLDALRHGDARGVVESVHSRLQPHALHPRAARSASSHLR
jgi:uncharacterized membrane protein YeiB